MFPRPLYRVKRNKRTQCGKSVLTSANMRANFCRQIRIPIFFAFGQNSQVVEMGVYHVKQISIALDQPLIGPSLTGMSGLMRKGPYFTKFIYKCMAKRFSLIVGKKCPTSSKRQMFQRSPVSRKFIASFSDFLRKVNTQKSFSMNQIVMPGKIKKCLPVRPKSFSLFDDLFFRLYQ